MGNFFLQMTVVVKVSVHTHCAKQLQTGDKIKQKRLSWYWDLIGCQYLHVTVSEH